MFNENLLTQCRELQFKRQHIDPTPLPEIINKEKSMRWKKYKIIENENVACNS